MNTALALQPENPNRFQIDVSKLDEKETRIVNLLAEKISGWYEVADAIREMIRERGVNWPEHFAEKQSLFTASFIRKMSLIGIKRTPLTAIGATPGARALGKCPLDDQKRYETEPLELLIRGGETLKVEIHNLTKDQARQVFASDHVRSVAEQKAWVESEKMRFNMEANTAPIQRAQRWEIRGKKLYVGDFVFTAREVKRINEQLNGKKA